LILLLSTPVFASSFDGNATTMFRQTTIDLYGSNGTFSPVYEFISYNFEDVKNFDGSVYLRARTGNVYYSPDPNDVLLYSAYADWKPNDNFVLRTGRQTIYQDISVFSIDGFKVDLPQITRQLGISAYIGKPANLYSGNPDRNLLGFRTNINLRENLSMALDYFAEQQGGADLRKVGGLKVKADLRNLSLDGLVNYDMLRTVTKNYSLNASLPVGENLNLMAQYNAETPEFDPQSVFAVFKYAYNPVKRSSAGANYNFNDNIGIYGWYGMIDEDAARGRDWRLGLTNKSFLLFNTSVDYYKTEGLDGDRSNLLCCASRQINERFKFTGQVGFNTLGTQNVTTGGADLTYNLRENIDLGINYQAVLGGFNQNSKLVASASINLGE